MLSFTTKWPDGVIAKVLYTDVLVAQAYDPSKTAPASVKHAQVKAI